MPEYYRKHSLESSTLVDLVHMPRQDQNGCERSKKQNWDSKPPFATALRSKYIEHESYDN
jgi:hypothetical protein